MMNRHKEELLAKLNELAKPSNTWLEDAKFRVANRSWLKQSQAIALKILRTLRTQGKTQKQLAEALQLSPQQVNKWVKGKENFTLETIAKIEAVLDIDLIKIPQEKPKDWVFGVSKTFTQSFGEVSKTQSYTHETGGKVIKLTSASKFNEKEKDLA